MSEKRRPQRPNSDVAFCQGQIGSLIEILDHGDFEYDIDAPSNPKGDWWIDISFCGFTSNVLWSAKHGFGLFTSTEGAYGDRPDEIYREPELAAKRLKQLATREPLDNSSMRLQEVRQLLERRQGELAIKLHTPQSNISRLENSKDAKITSLCNYVEALGGEVTLVARFDGFEAPVYLPCHKALNQESSDVSDRITGQAEQMEIFPSRELL